MQLLRFLHRSIRMTSDANRMQVDLEMQTFRRILFDLNNYFRLTFLAFY